MSIVRFYWFCSLCAKVEDYSFSSFAEYLHKSTIVDTDFALGMIDRNDFTDFNNAPNSDACLELTGSPRRAVTDTQAQEIVRKISHCNSVTEFQSLGVGKKERYIRKIYDRGVSIRQLSRLTGTTKGMIEKYLKR